MPHAKPHPSQDRRAADNRFGALLDAAADAIILIDGDGRITRFNHAAERLFGYSEAEVFGSNVSVLMPEPQRSEHDQYLQRYQRTGEARIIGIGREVTALRKDGGQFPMELAVGEFRHGEETGYVGILRDLTEKYRQRDTEAAVRRELEELNGRLAHASRLHLLGEMASGIAHEVNQPITAIGNYAAACRRLLKSGGMGAPELDDTLQKIGAQAERAGQVIQGLRSFARRQDPVREQADVNALVRDLVKLVDFDLRSSGWRLALDLAPDLPPVSVDSVQIQQVLLNLVRNGMEAMLEQAHGDRVEVSTAAAPGEVVIRVRDCGPGVSPAMRDHLFEPFHSSKSDGLGLGLSICQSIAATHRGRLELVEDGQRGACFALRLPVAGD